MASSLRKKVKCVSAMSMADLLASQETKNLKLERNQEIEGEIIQIGEHEIILDLGSKAEGVLSSKEFSDEQLNELKEGKKIKAFVLRTENESGQVVLGLAKTTIGSVRGGNKNWDKFISAKNKSQVFKGKALEINRGGLIVEVDGTRGFLPSSQLSLSQAANSDELVGQTLQVSVLEVDPGANKLIFSQKITIPGDTKKKLAEIKTGEKIKGVVEAILPFGVFAKIDGEIDALAHISELAWEKVEETGSLYKVGDEIEGVVTGIDLNSGRVNFSVKQLQGDPFAEVAEKFQPEDVISGTVTKVSSNGVSLELEGGVEGLIASGKMEGDMDYPIGKKITCLVDSVDSQKRRINLVPFRTSTKDLIYK